MRLPLIAALLGLIAQPVAADVCKDGATLTYPVTETIRSAAIMVDVARYRTIDPFASVESIMNPTPQEQQDRLDRAVEATQSILMQLKQPERDILTLAMLDQHTHDDVPLFTLLFFDMAYGVPSYLDALDRNDMPQHAGIIRRAMALFGPPDTPYQTRYDMWLASENGDADPRLAARFKGLTERYLAVPSPLEKATELLGTDPAIEAKYEAYRQSTSDTYRYFYLLGQIGACTETFEYYADLTSADVAALPQPQQHIARLSVIGWEAADGGFTEYFSSPIADNTPVAIDLLDKYRLTDHADALRAGMGQFPTPFPRDAYAREVFIYDTMSEADANALHEMGVVFQDDAIMRKITALAKDVGLWPE